MSDKFYVFHRRILGRRDEDLVQACAVYASTREEAKRLLQAELDALAEAGGTANENDREPAFRENPEWNLGIEEELVEPRVLALYLTQ